MFKKSLLAMTAIAIAMPAFAEFPILKSIPKEFQGCWVHQLQMDWDTEKRDYYFIVSNNKIETITISGMTMEEFKIKQNNNKHLIFAAKETNCEYGDCHTEVSYGELILKNGKLIFKRPYGSITYSRCSAKQRKEASDRFGN